MTMPIMQMRPKTFDIVHVFIEFCIVLAMIISSSICINSPDMRKIARFVVVSLFLLVILDRSRPLSLKNIS